jgi:hypothetical protein
MNLSIDDSGERNITVKETEDHQEANRDDPRPTFDIEHLHSEEDGGREHDRGHSKPGEPKKVSICQRSMQIPSEH